MSNEVARSFLPSEIWWAENYTLLLSHGYALRKRYSPDWVPTWEQPGNDKISPWACEDSIVLHGVCDAKVADATRTADGVKVVLKRVQTGQEADLSFHFGKILLEDYPHPDNRAVPVLDMIQLPQQLLVVMPFLREFDDPPFERLGQVSEALHQFLKASASGYQIFLADLAANQGTQYFHERHVAHRDLGPGNLMMDATCIIPGGWHMCQPWSTDLTISTGIESVPRHIAGPVNYFIIDFGLSMGFPMEMPLEYARDTGVFGQYWRQTPELSDTIPNNPFKVDIWQLGNVIAILLKKYDGLDIFRDLAGKMTATDPDQRPWIGECLNIFEGITSTIDEDAPLQFNSSDSSSDSAGPASEDKISENGT
ncbi:kinase-like domain-containing protein [Favolaschia claudopus]|uniref:Kinase-like domain-containing protein n=1 Tax=Favolaschia claudopus TaxID=2862362 RepID=A0AAW0AEM1_9AGAR